MVGVEVTDVFGRSGEESGVVTFCSTLDVGLRVTRPSAAAPVPSLQTPPGLLPPLATTSLDGMHNSESRTSPGRRSGQQRRNIENSMGSANLRAYCLCIHERGTVGGCTVTGGIMGVLLKSCA